MGWLRLTPDQIYSLTLRQFFNMVEGYNEVRQSDTEFNYQTRMESARFTAAMVIHSLAGKKFDASFPWDKPAKIKVMDPARFEYLQKLWKIK